MSIHAYLVDIQFNGVPEDGENEDVRDEGPIRDE